MPDTTALEMQARELSPTVSPRLVDHALNFFSRALFTLALTFGGLIVATAVLMAGVVGSPVIVVVLAALALRRRYAPRAGAFATTG
jgi:hypothetical protein